MCFAAISHTFVAPLRILQHRGKKQTERAVLSRWTLILLSHDGLHVPSAPSETPTGGNREVFLTDTLLGQGFTVICVCRRGASAAVMSNIQISDDPRSTCRRRLRGSERVRFTLYKNILHPHKAVSCSRSTDRNQTTTKMNKMATRSHF